MLAPVTPVHDKWLSDGVVRTPETVLAAAAAEGVTRVIAIGTTLEDSVLAVQLASEHRGVWASIGIHPHEADKYVSAASISDVPVASRQKSAKTEPIGSTHRVSQEHQKRFRALLGEKRVVAIGECGLDYFYEHSSRAAQETVFRFQLEMALEYDLPLSLHVRNAFDDFWRIIQDYPGIRGVLHSFTDSRANMARAVEQGLYIGVNGIATFTKDAEQLVTYRTIPQHSLLLETDAPFLTPVPFRGKMCEPKHVALTAHFLAELRSERVEQTAAYTAKNATTLFKLTE